MNAKTILSELRIAASAEKRAVLACFFKSGSGEYGEGDRFLVVMAPQIRAVAKSAPIVVDAGKRSPNMKPKKTIDALM